MSSDVPWEVRRLAEIADDWKQTWKPRESTAAIVDHYSIPAFDQGREPSCDRPADIKSNKRVVAKDAVLVSRLNPSTPRIWAPSLKAGRESVCSTEMLVLRPREGVDRSFLHYLCWSPHVSTALLERVSGTTGSHQRVAARDVLSLPVPVPPLSQQRAIAEVLGALDDRIEWCGRAVDLAYELQDAFFAELNAREGVRRRPLGDFVQLNKGVSYTGADITDDRGAPALVNLGNFGRGRAPRWEKLKRYRGPTRPRHHVSQGEVVICATDMTHDRVVLGKALIVPERLGAAAISHHLYAMRIQPDAPLSPWVAVLALSHEPIRRVVASYANGTTVLSLPRDAIERAEVPIPPREQQAAFDSSVAQLQAAIEHCNDQAATLRQLRDILLPKLLSGELRIENPERLLEGVA